MKFPETKLRADVVNAIQLHAKISGINAAAKGSFFPLRPSSALKSERELYYGLINYYKPGSIAVNPIEGRNTMLLALGHALEKHFVEYIEKAFAVPYRNVRVVYGELKDKDGQSIPLSGELDFVIQNPESGELIIADSKSSADFPFKSGIPKDEHIAQINLYLHSPWAKERGIKRALIMYYNKNNSDLKAFEFTYSPELAEEVIAKFQRVLNAYNAGQVPAREHVFGLDWQAAYSSFKTHDNKEFETPVPERAVSNITESEIEDLDRKEILKYLAIRPDSGNIFVTERRKFWIDIGATTLLLKEEKL